MTRQQLVPSIRIWAGVTVLQFSLSLQQELGGNPKEYLGGDLHKERILQHVEGCSIMTKQRFREMGQSLEWQRENKGATGPLHPR